MEIKQLKYFVVSADVGSFSEAATILYTTQSSVSKVIASLEQELDYPLFKRENKGIALTDKGRALYQKAGGLVADFDRLERDKGNLQRNVVRIGSIHSSWIANCFSDFYELHKDEDCCFYIHADSPQALVERLKLSEDEVGFIYIFPNTKTQIEYLIKKNNLRFVSLKKMDGMVYFAPEDIAYTNQNGERSYSNLKFIQSENDEYVRFGKWKTEDGIEFNVNEKIAVVTNSDYVMHNMLEKNHLANLGAQSFNNYERGYGPGIELFNDDGQIEFGYLINKDYTPSDLAVEFIDYIRHAIEE
ncbi:DNA-binding transcriptional regulator, LysR family [Pseudobutyrivibrio sp. ACV-2]|uniref:LysR family transcriptional regulator n=1 Tax=Pseudobutyrivibrio sp. ACV-2 TaxID=1520801 RepID=UPI000897A33D|nr:LysR family transcriptional regulator [Pseudobutyrivibrio sp. ACV-2]SDZ88736.1 DNA-binding transcriptional regulator, LysR family [Pseudobutyrivibrio sp. ACV-2]